MAGTFSALLVAPAALADIFGPDLTVVGQSLNTSVSLNVKLAPSYNQPKPGVVVTMTNCGSGGLKVTRRIGTLGANQTFRASSGKIVWTVKTVPAKPAKPKLNLRLALPKSGKTLCVRTSMYDNYTKKTVKTTNRIPL